MRDLQFVGQSARFRAGFFHSCASIIPSLRREMERFRP
jgi:hypothetical protein